MVAQLLSLWGITTSALTPSDKRFSDWVICKASLELAVWTKTPTPNLLHIEVKRSRSLAHRSPRRVSMESPILTGYLFWGFPQPISVDKPTNKRTSVFKLFILSHLSVYLTSIGPSGPS